MMSSATNGTTSSSSANTSTSTITNLCSDYIEDEEDRDNETEDEDEESKEEKDDVRLVLMRPHKRKKLNDPEENKKQKDLIESVIADLNHVTPSAKPADSKDVCPDCLITLYCQGCNKINLCPHILPQCSHNICFQCCKKSLPKCPICGASLASSGGITAKPIVNLGLIALFEHMPIYQAAKLEYEQSLTFYLEQLDDYENVPWMIHTRLGFEDAQVASMVKIIREDYLAHRAKNLKNLTLQRINVCRITSLATYVDSISNGKARSMYTSIGKTLTYVAAGYANVLILKTRNRYHIICVA